MNWKTPPADSTKVWINKSMELQILLLCNWSCQACDQHSNLPGLSFVRKATMTTAQINRFIAEMKDRNAYLGRIRVLGGEPTIHPRFQDIIHLLHSQLVPRHVSQIEVVTNGTHPEHCNAINHLARIRVSGEAAKQKHHVANFVHTPSSLGYEGHMCNAPWHCGFSLNYYGYFPCSAGAGVARLHDWMHWQRLHLPTSIRDTWPDLQNLCDHCYHALKDEHKIRCGTTLFQLNVPSKDTWTHLAPWLNGKQPEWKVYGAEVSETVPTG